jgi:uncharacterized protein (TIGR02147 family)
MAKRAPVDVFAYRDYRAFLLAFFERRQAQEDGYSYAKFANEVGLRTPNYAKLVVSGARNLGADLAVRFGEACSLHGDALKYFCALVAFNQSKNARERELHYAELQSFNRFRASHRFDAAQSAYHSTWFIPAIYELAARDDFRDEPQWIAQTLLPSITAREAAHALGVLRRLGLLKEGAHGRLLQAEAVLETPEGPLGHHIASFHRTMMQRAAEAIDLVPRDDREVAGLTLCVSEERMRELKVELERFRTHLLERYMKDERPERVVQVNFQMFPLSRRVKGK